MTLETLKKDVAAAVDAMAGELLSLSHAIHQEPELALEEVKAAARLTAAVEAHGLPVQREAFGLKTAYVSEFGNAGPEIAILSEYDALPGVGHACGHNIIATSALGAALALAKIGGKMPGRMRYHGHAGGRTLRRQGDDRERRRFRRCGRRDDDASGKSQSHHDALHRDLGSRSGRIMAERRTPPPCRIAG